MLVNFSNLNLLPEGTVGQGVPKFKKIFLFNVGLMVIVVFHTYQALKKIYFLVTSFYIKFYMAC